MYRVTIDLDFAKSQGHSLEEIGDFIYSIVKDRNMGYYEAYGIPNRCEEPEFELYVTFVSDDDFLFAYDLAMYLRDRYNREAVIGDGEYNVLVI